MVVNHWWFGLLTFIIYTPLCWIRKIAVFNKTHLFADVIIVVMILAIIVYAILDVVDGKKPHGYQPINWESWLEMVGFAVYTYEGIGVVLPIS